MRDNGRYVEHSWGPTSQQSDRGRRASERDGLSSCGATHSSIDTHSSGASRIAVTGSRLSAPVNGRPRFLARRPEIAEV